MNQLVMLPIDSIYPHPDNPRKDLGKLDELAESIKKNGVMQNLTVVPKEPSTYTVIIGHRRLAASKLAGLTAVPCVITAMTPNEQISTMLLENVQRAELTPFEQMKGFQMLLDLGETVETISQKTGFSSSTVRRRIKLVELDEKKLAEAMARQVTLADLAKLEEITDIKVRNQCLERAGTSSFEMTIRNALVEQKIKANKKPMLAELKRIMTALTNTRQYSFKGSFLYSEYVPGQFDKYIGKDYGFQAYASSVYIYKKCETVAKKESAKEKDIRRIENELKNATVKAYQLRKAFIESYEPSKKDELKLYKICAEGLMFTVEHGLGVCSADLFKLYSKKRPDNYIERKEVYEEILHQSKLKAVISYIWCSLDYTSAGGFYEHRYQEYPKHQKCLRLNRLYDFLVALGYEMSDLEIQLSSGAHPLFKQGDNQ